MPTPEEEIKKYLDFRFKHEFEKTSPDGVSERKSGQPLQNVRNAIRARIKSELLINGKINENDYLEKEEPKP
jgi:hypothetical protein